MAVVRSTARRSSELPLVILPLPRPAPEGLPRVNGSASWVFLYSLFPHSPWPHLVLPSFAHDHAIVVASPTQHVSGFTVL